MRIEMVSKADYDTTIFILRGSMLIVQSPIIHIIMHMRARRALSFFKDVPLRTRRALSV